MKANLKITFKDTKSSSHVIELIEKKYENLRRKYGDIIRCQVVLDLPHRKNGEAEHYRVTIRLKTPTMDLVGRSKNQRNGNGDMFKGVSEAFQAINAQIRHRTQQKSASLHYRKADPFFSAREDSLFAA